MRHLVQFSTGMSSAEVAWRLVREHGPSAVVLLTADTTGKGGASDIAAQHRWSPARTVTRRNIIRQRVTKVWSTCLDCPAIQIEKYSGWGWRTEPQRKVTVR